jgi:RNA-directed DNA polymerase
MEKGSPHKMNRAWAIRALRRCGNWDNGSDARSGLIVNTNNTPTNTNTNISFRADSNYSQKACAQGRMSSARIKGAQSPCRLMLTGKTSKPVSVRLVRNSRTSGRPFIFPLSSGSGSHMKRHADLFPRICNLENIYHAHRVCLRGKRLTRGVLPFTYNLSRELHRIRRDLLSGTYRVGNYYSFYVTEPKRRLVQALPFRDRVVQQALCQVIEPIFLSTFIRDNYACIKGRGTHAGAAQLTAYLRKSQARWGKTYCLQCDIAGYFPSIHHHILLDLFRRKIKCKPTLRLIEQITNSNHQVVGIPIGNLLSQLSANIYLSPLDHHVKEHWRLPYYIRYMDDFVILHGSKKYLGWLKQEIKTYINDHLALALNKKTAVFPASRGVDFLGYRIWPTHRLVRKRSVKKAKRKFAAMARQYHAGRMDLQTIAASTRSWAAHCEHADTYRLRSKVFKDLSKKIKGAENVH